MFLKKVATLTGKQFFRARVDIENVASQAMMRKLGAYPNGVSEFLLYGQLLEEFKSENIDKIDDNIRNIACEFKMTPEDIYAVGRVAQSQLGYLETIDYIRHPSYGGKTECVNGILSIK